MTRRSNDLVWMVRPTPLMPERLQVGLLLTVALTIRLVYWLDAGGPKLGGDSSRSITAASALAAGDVGPLLQWPIQPLYALAIAPIYALGIPQPLYLAVLHLALSTATVLLLYKTGKLLASPMYGMTVGALAAVHPFFLFWLPYVLNETLFLFSLALFIYVYVRLLKEPALRTALWLAGAGALLALSRPLSVTALVASCVFLACYLAHRRWTLKSAAAGYAAGGAALLCAALLVLGAVQALQRNLTRSPTVVQALWAGTELRTGNLADVREFEARDQQVDEMFADAPLELKSEYKRGEALRFIREHPAIYIRLAARKLVSYVYPWVFANTWSRTHLALDVLISLLLTFGALRALVTREVELPVLFALLALAASFALLAAFSQMDPDGRYRLPAELALLIVAPAGWKGLLAVLGPHPVPPAAASHIESVAR